MPSQFRRQVTDSFVEIDEQEFNSVSQSIRQRVPLSEVNFVSGLQLRIFVENIV